MTLFMSRACMQQSANHNVILISQITFMWSRDCVILLYICIYGSYIHTYINMRLNRRLNRARYYITFRKQLNMDICFLLVCFHVRAYLKQHKTWYSFVLAGWYSLHLHLFLTYTRLFSLGALLTLHTVLIISGKRPIHTIINFSGWRNWAGHRLTVPHFWWKMGIHKAGKPGEFTSSTVWLFIPRLIACVCLHYTRWPGVNLVAALLLFSFRLCPIATLQCVYSLSHHPQKITYVQ